MSSEEFTEPPLGKLPYERRPHDLPPPSLEELQTLALDPLKWRPVSWGLTLIFWGYFVILALLGCFAIVAIWSRFLKESPADYVTTIVGILFVIGVIAIFLAGLMILVGNCLCVAVPRISGARLYMIVSLLGTGFLATLTGLAFFATVSKAMDDPNFFKVSPKKVVAGPDQAQPAAEPAKQDDQDPANKKDAPLQDSSVLLKLLMQLPFLVSQFFFILFLRKVALFFRQPFLADSMSGYQTLLIFFVALNVLLPSVAMTACFFWVVMLGIQIVMAIWQIRLVAATRRAMGS